MLTHKASTQTESCQACQKNNTLIKKYEQLIHLYKKKQVRLSVDGSSRISNVRTTSHTIEMPNGEGNWVGGFRVLEGVVRRRLRLGFDGMVGGTENRKLAVLAVCNRVSKMAKLKAFRKIKQLHGSIDGNGKSVLGLQRGESTKQSESILGKEHNRIPVIQQLISDSQSLPTQIPSQYLSNLSHLLSSIPSAPPTLPRSLTQLQLSNKRLSLQNSILKQCIQDLHRRQTKDNEKKRESLEMLAQEISEKNQEIVGLRQLLRKYEGEGDGEGDVLGDDVGVMRGEIQHLERVRDKLHGDLDKVKAELQKTNKVLKEVQAKNLKLESEHLEREKKAFEAGISLAKSQKVEQQLSKVIKKLNQKLKRLNTYEKQLEQHLENPGQPLTSSVHQQLKSQIILLYLTNISDSNYKLEHGQLFDEEERGLLERHKQEWGKLLDEERMLLRIQKGNGKGCQVDFSGIKGKGGHMDSIFQALDSPREVRREEEISNRQGPTMRLLELQLEKNKQIQKISELKQKFLHIRVIILKLLKSLELQPNLKPETLDILRLLFDLFEYSEEERESIFVKKRKLFNLF